MKCLCCGRTLVVRHVSARGRSATRGALGGGGGGTVCQEMAKLVEISPALKFFRGERRWNFLHSPPSSCHIHRLDCRILLAEFNNHVEARASLHRRSRVMTGTWERSIRSSSSETAFLSMRRWRKQSRFTTIFSQRRAPSWSTDGSQLPRWCVLDGYLHVHISLDVPASRKTKLKPITTKCHLDRLQGCHCQ